MLRVWRERVRGWWSALGEPVDLLTPEQRDQVDDMFNLVRDDERSACIHQLEQLATTVPSESDELLGIRRAIALLHQPDEAV